MFHNASGSRRLQSETQLTENEKITLALLEIVKGKGFNKTPTDISFKTVSLPPRSKLDSNSINNYLHLDNCSSRSLNSTPSTSRKPTPYVGLTRKANVPADCVSVESGFGEGLETDLSRSSNQLQFKSPTKFSKPQVSGAFKEGLLNKLHSFGEISKSVVLESVAPKLKVSNAFFGGEKPAYETLSWRPNQTYVSEAEYESTPNTNTHVLYSFSSSSNSEYETDSSTCSERRSALNVRSELHWNEQKQKDSDNEEKDEWTIDLNGDVSLITNDSPQTLSNISSTCCTAQSNSKRETVNELYIKDYNCTKLKMPVCKDVTSNKTTETCRIDVTYCSEKHIANAHCDNVSASDCLGKVPRLNSVSASTKLHDETYGEKLIPAQQPVSRKYEKCGRVSRKENEPLSNSVYYADTNTITEPYSDLEIEYDCTNHPSVNQYVNVNKIAETSFHIDRSRIHSTSDQWTSYKTNDDVTFRHNVSVRKKSPRVVLKKLDVTLSRGLSSKNYFKKTGIKEVKTHFNDKELEQQDFRIEDIGQKSVAYDDQSCYTCQTVNIPDVKSFHSVNQVDDKENETNGQKPKLTSQEITLESWIIKLKQKGVIVEGNRLDDNFGPWQSSTITQRISKRKVKTKSGSVYILQGSMCCATAEAYGLPKELIESFRSGFPTTWGKLVEDAVMTFSRLTRSMSESKKPQNLTRLTSASERKQDKRTSSASTIEKTKRPTNSVCSNKIKPSSRSRSIIANDEALNESTPESNSSCAKSKSKTAGKGLHLCQYNCCGADNSESFSEKFSPDSLPRTRSGRIVIPRLEYWHNQYCSYRGGKPVLVAGCPGNSIEIPLPDIVTSCQTFKVPHASKKSKSSVRKDEWEKPKEKITDEDAAEQQNASKTTKSKKIVNSTRKEDPTTEQEMHKKNAKSKMQIKQFKTTSEEESAEEDTTEKETAEEDTTEKETTGEDTTEEETTEEDTTEKEMAEEDTAEKETAEEDASEHVRPRGKAKSSIMQIETRSEKDTTETVKHTKNSKALRKVQTTTEENKSEEETARLSTNAYKMLRIKPKANTTKVKTTTEEYVTEKETAEVDASEHVRPRRKAKSSIMQVETTSEEDTTETVKPSKNAKLKRKVKATTEEETTEEPTSKEDTVEEYAAEKETAQEDASELVRPRRKAKSSIMQIETTSEEDTTETVKPSKNAKLKRKVKATTEEETTEEPTSKDTVEEYAAEKETAQEDASELVRPRRKVKSSIMQIETMSEEGTTETVKPSKNAKLKSKVKATTEEETTEVSTTKEDTAEEGTTERRMLRKDTKPSTVHVETLTQENTAKQIKLRENARSKQKLIKARSKLETTGSSEGGSIEKNTEKGSSKQLVTQPSKEFGSQIKKCFVDVKRNDAISKNKGCDFAPQQRASCKTIDDNSDHTRKNEMDTNSSSEKDQCFKLSQSSPSAKKLFKMVSVTPKLKNRLRRSTIAKANIMKSTVATSQKLPLSCKEMPIVSNSKQMCTQKTVMDTTDGRNKRYVLRVRDSKPQHNSKNMLSEKVGPSLDSDIYTTIEDGSARMNLIYANNVIKSHKKHSSKCHPESNKPKDTESEHVVNRSSNEADLRKQLFSTTEVELDNKRISRRKRKAVKYVAVSYSSSDDDDDAFASVLKKLSNKSRTGQPKKVKVVTEKKADAKKPPEVTARKGTIARKRQVRDYLKYASQGYEADVGAHTDLGTNLPALPHLVGEDESSSDEDVNCMTSKTPPSWLHLTVPRSARRTPVLPDYINPRVLDSAERKAVDKYIHNRRKKGQESPLTKRPRAANPLKSMAQMDDLPDDVFNLSTRSNDDDVEEQDEYFSDAF